MNPLQENPHLFANRKFRVRVDYGAEIVSWTLTPDILAQINRNNLMSQCTLIARPIEDMTGEEVYDVMDYREYYDPEYHAQEKEFRMELISRQRKYYIDNIRDFESRQSMLYLLSIGVYPFDQSHFDDGTVIDKTTIQ